MVTPAFALADTHPAAQPVILLHVGFSASNLFERLLILESVIISVLAVTYLYYVFTMEPFTIVDTSFNFFCANTKFSGQRFHAYLMAQTIMMDNFVLEVPHSVCTQMPAYTYIENIDDMCHLSEVDLCCFTLCWQGVRLRQLGHLWISESPEAPHIGSRLAACLASG